MVLELERRGATAWLWLNRPEQRNALNAEVQSALAARLDSLERDPDVRVLVLAGRGPAFCAGGDLNRMQEAAKLARRRAQSEAAGFARLLARMAAFPKPLVARVHGPAYAGGMGLAAACDLVVAAEGAEFCLPEVRIGLVPAMISPYVVRALGERQARRYMLSAERLGAREAWRLGFVHECVAAAQLDATVERLARQLAQAGPQALARTKALVTQVAAAPLGERLSLMTARVLADARAGDEAKEGIRSFLEKRKPSWSEP